MRSAFPMVFDRRHAEPFMASLNSAPGPQAAHLTQRHCTRAYVYVCPECRARLGPLDSARLPRSRLPVPRAVGQLLTSAPTRGADYRLGAADREWETAERLGSASNAVLLAVVCSAGRVQT